MSQSEQIPSKPVTICGGENSLIIAIIDGALVILHWGKSLASSGDLSDLISAKTKAIAHSDFDQMQWQGIFREHARGNLGSPMISGHRNSQGWSTRFEVRHVAATKSSLDFMAEDSAAKLELQGRYEFDNFGILRVSYKLINRGAPYNLENLTYWLPLPQRAKERIDFTGRWANERQIQRARIDTGLWARQTREGRSGHDFTIAQIALTEKSDFQSGELWSAGLAWSGNSAHYIEKSYDGELWMGAGEVLFPGEVVLNEGESYEAPTLVASFSDRGLDGLAENHHRSLRARNHHPKRPRPLTLNMWEAIYFDHSPHRVMTIVDAAAKIGVERVVLDDGWFGSRRDDRSGLGDWQVSQDVWPDGLRPLADYVRAKGMEFGLWFEGEMINPDSNLYRSHPDWVLQTENRAAPLWRNQLVLDLSRDEVFRYIFDSVSAVISEVGVSYIKWDHNRVLADASSAGRARYRAQVDAIYRLFDQLKATHAGLEIESCASGGGRIDLGMIDHVDRFWTSDNNDALARVDIQRWSAQFIPPELLGTHIGPIPNHQSGRSTPLAMRAAVALFGHAGIEWDFTAAGDEDRENLAKWIAFYKGSRQWLHSARLIRLDHADPAASQPDPIILRGLSSGGSYEVKPVFPAGKPHQMSRREVGWFEGITASGDELENIGLTTPILEPDNALLIEIRAVD
jgi:alpha-galactosidase